MVPRVMASFELIRLRAVRAKKKVRAVRSMNS